MPLSSSSTAGNGASSNDQSNFSIITISPLRSRTPSPSTSSTTDGGHQSPKQVPVAALKKHMDEESEPYLINNTTAVIVYVVQCLITAIDLQIMI